MTASTSLDDPAVRLLLDRYLTCELATLNRSGVPVAWPTTPMFDPERGTFLITASIGFPQKVYNIRRDPRVGLLYSDPTGSGLPGTTELLVQGEARCTDEIITSPDGVEGLAQWWQRTWRLQPNGLAIGSDPLTRRLMDFYYRRVVITVTPTRVHERPALPPRTGRAGAAAAPRPGSTSGEAVRHLSRYDSAVLAARDADGLPWLLRVRPGLDAASGTLLLDVPRDEPVAPGPASLLCHRHDENMWGLRSVAVLGDLTRRGQRWSLTPTRVVPSADSSPLGMARMIRGCRRSAAAYLRRRQLAPPPVDWTAIEALKAAAKRPAQSAR